MIKNTKKLLSLILALVLAVSCATGVIFTVNAVDTGESASEADLPSKYATNPNGMVGKRATITIDGSFSDWSEEMLIAQGAAWDVANHWKGGHENCVLDTYSLYGAWDNDNLYVAWQMVNTTDTWAREGDGSLSDGGRVLDVPLILALSIDPTSVCMSNKNTDGGSIWGWQMGVTFETHVDCLLYMSGKAGNGEPGLFKAVDAAGNTNYTTGLTGFAAGGIEYKMAESFMPSTLIGLNYSESPDDVFSEDSDWVDYLTFTGSSGKHNTKYDSFYEIKIPFSTLGIDANYVESNGIGAMLLATRGESALDCIPFDPSMLDNATGEYSGDPSTSHEKDDEDVITVPLAQIGNMGGSVPSTTAPTTEPDITAPPTTVPPTTVPHTTEPPTTEPPTTEPSTTEPTEPVPTLATISDCTITLSDTSYTYDGTAKKPSITVKDGSTTLTSGTDYTVSYSNNTNVGTATVTVTGKGNYTGTATKNFTINAKSISDCTTTLGTTTYTYDGTAKKPSITVKDGSTTLTSGTDYTVSYLNNTNVGTATVTVTGKGNYTGKATKDFTITQAKTEFTWGEDNWNFNNSSSYFANYNVNSYVMNLMKEDFGLSNADIYELNKKIANDNYYGFNGSCFGMTVSEILSKQGDLKLSRYGGNDIVNRNSNTSNMTSVINFIQELQSNSKFCQSIRQAPFLSGSYSQYDFIDKLESVLENEDNIVKISYAINSINRNTNKYSSNGYHAVLGYGVENCNYYSEITGKSYDKRILIADPNYLSQNSVYNESCLYYRSSDHSWIVPYWNKKYSTTTQLCYWNSGSAASTNTGYIRNIMRYDSLTETVDLMTDYRVSHYVAGLEVENISQNITLVEQLENTGNPNYDYAGESGSGIARYDIEMDDSFTVNENDEFYALWNPTASYSMSYETPSKYNLKMDYNDISYYANLTNSTYTSFKPSGNIKAVGSNASYSLTIVTDESACVTDWFVVEVSGKDVDNVTYNKVDNGYVLTASNLDNVTVKANGDNSEVSVTFSTDYDSVYIYEIDANTIGLKVDTDNNGTYETELNTGTPDEPIKIKGDVNSDGEYNIRDAAAIQLHIAQLYNGTFDESVADVNGDGEIGIKDAAYIQLDLAKLL